MEMLVTRGFDMLLMFFCLFVSSFYFFVLFFFVFKSGEVRTFEHLVITPRYEICVSRKSAWRFHLCFCEISGVWGLVITKGLTAD